MLRRLASLGAIAVLVLTLGVTGCSDDDCETCPPSGAAPALSYVGSASCGDAACHQSTYEVFIESGHPYKLSAVVDATAPTFPWDSEHPFTVTNDGPPPGTTWDDFAHVIGGYGWKARWVKPDGNVYTAGTEAQLNLWSPGADKWVPYHEDEVKPYNYSCFKCHTTGASEEGSWPEGTTGFGTFVFGGVECEECHGQGSQHAFDPVNFALTVDDSPEACGRCHTRDSQNRIAISNGFIKHHEQFDETIHSPHAAVGCGGCHDPHASVKYDSVAQGDGVKTQCVTCHGDKVNNTSHSLAATCTNCHMPKAARSARNDDDYRGDIASHLWTLRTTEETKDTMWTSDGKFVALDEFGRGSLTLDFACYGCHTDEAGVGGGTARQLDMAALSARAQVMHPVAPAKVSMK